MADIDVNMTLRAYDHTCPLLLGDVPTPGVRLKIDRHAPLTLQLPDGLDVAEVSFNRYTLGRARGDDSLIGMPAFILQGFRHRNFFVRADSKLAKLADLRGRKLGTNSWPDTGTMWARAAMRDAGVEIADVEWTIGTLDAKTPNKPPSPNDAQPPRGARFLTGTENLLAELEAGGIDAVTTAFAPEPVFQKGGWIRRLVQNYPEVEADYRRRVGFYPGFHIVAVRRSFAEKRPDVMLTIYDAMRAAFDLWTAKVKKFAEASPWAMHELEILLRDFEGDTPPFGLEAPSLRKMVAAICSEQHAQGLVATAARPEDLFADFEKLRQKVR
jgi:4,5-dihydroxyphthalate decarboxylase